MIFDQYSRYKACSEFIKQANYAPGKTILDVGSGPECLFGKFIRDANVTYVDPLIAINSPEKYISGDVHSRELDGKSFDYVIAVDVLEHIPAELRKPFLTRLSSLCKDTLILGFPSSDSTVAIDADNAIDAQYRAIFGHDYPWLKEHHEYGLPSLLKTVECLNGLGWQCQSVEHGHAPWLQKLLGFVICAWDIPTLHDVVRKISEKFKHDLYPYDFQPPCYRQFVIASHNFLMPITTPAGKFNSIEANKIFQNLLEDLRRLYFTTSMQQLIKQKNLVAERDLALTEKNASLTVRDVVAAERDAAVAQRDVAVEQRDSAFEQRDSALAELSKIKNSKTFRLAQRLTAAKWVIVNRRLSDHDRIRIRETLHGVYHQFPLPIRNTLRWGYTKFVRSPSKAIKRNRLAAIPFQHPEMKPAQKTKGLFDYIFWGVIDWHFRHQRPQHLAQNLALAGRRVFYVSAVLLDDDRPGFEVEALDDSGSLFQVKLYARGGSSIYASAADKELSARLRGSAGELLLWAGCREVISFVQHPFWYEVAAGIPNCRLVYDCMDYHEGFGNIAPEIIALEKDLLRTADLTVTSSQLLDQMASDRTAQRVLIRNAADFEHFSNPPSRLYRDERGRRVIGYYGAIAEWFDLDLVAAVAEKFREHCLVLVGSDTVRARSRLGRLPNVKFIGEVPYGELPYYLYGFDVCILPFKVVPLTRATNPVKVYEYLSAGRQVVSIDLPEMQQFGDLVRVADNHADFISAVAAAMDQEIDPDAVRRRRAFAGEQTWAHRVDTLMAHIETRATDPLVSVVVVTYNNLELTRACLASLGEHSGYDPLEIIVVDNASADGTREFLKEWAAAGINRRIVLNDDNRGFAAANNQGLAMAEGDYLVLLNNDTYVTPGWVRTLRNHLRRDQTIGLIGPVTNNIGNEAKIDLEYSDMQEMIEASAGYTLRNIGRTFPLRTAAFFCVMMRRGVYERVGPLDETFGIGFFEDDDYCRRIEQLGLRIVCAEDAFVHHQLSSSFNKLNNRERQVLFLKNKTIYEEKWGKWIPHVYRDNTSNVPKSFFGFEHIIGWCNICGQKTRFYFKEVALWRESLVCEHCRSTSRYRSIARGVLRAVGELNGCQVPSLADLARNDACKRLRIYDTQPPFYSDACAYPLPRLLRAADWIDLELSSFKPKKKLGVKLSTCITNQNLEMLTFDDEAFDIVVTSDVMEHVRLDFKAHREIHRVLRAGGIYLFTVPHRRERQDTLVRVQVVDPADPSKDVHLLEPEYHGDTNSDSGEKALSYRVYGRDLEETLSALGFEVDYFRDDIPENGILNTELYFCRKIQH
jgi:GT2 family glycosyltransferase/2-polyprenyl-3-methyl-5-hydroxy-6-metoxy-1,4-benzoquinol methylase/glycosyltransferase involved in cell wall biosynthesis